MYITKIGISYFTSFEVMASRSVNIPNKIHDKKKADITTKDVVFSMLARAEENLICFIKAPDLKFKSNSAKVRNTKNKSIKKNANVSPFFAFLPIFFPFLGVMIAIFKAYYVPPIPSVL